MKVRELAVTGAFEFTPRSFTDNRGLFVATFSEQTLVEATGRPMRVAQTNHSTSRCGVIRGVHFADVPPGQAKYIYCPRGALLDVVVDIRVGSPTFGAWDSVQCDDREYRAVFLPEGVGHAFLSLVDGSVMTYMCSTPYNPAAEHTINPLDPALGLPWPEDLRPVLSDRDAAAPDLAEAMASDLLPSYAECLSWYQTQGTLARQG